MDRHEIDQRDRAVLGLEVRFEDQRVGAIAPRDLGVPVARRDDEAAVLARAEQRREAGIRVEARPAQPVDRAIAADQRGALAVADQRVVFDAACGMML